ncbi:hypothetical protein [Eggerthella sinensis]|uniref:hypothetical protein n=1 Tax=Eggerthella sinensis TaxID=242230 RepID=UPI0022E86F69|nr:hypothetical protein [Eggerthella sinensis]
MVAEKRDRILQAVMSVLERDYAGAPEKAPLNETKQWLTAFGEAWKGNRLDDELFTCYLTQYLATLHDPNLSLLVSAECPYQLSAAGSRCAGTATSCTWSRCARTNGSRWATPSCC